MSVRRCGVIGYGLKQQLQPPEELPFDLALLMKQLAPQVKEAVGILSAE